MSAIGRRRLIALGLLGLPSVFACSPRSSAANAWRGLLKVGLVLPLHGEDPGTAVATHVSVHELLTDANRAGGLSGRRLELVTLDDDSSESTRRRRLLELAADPYLAIAYLYGDIVPLGMNPIGGLAVRPIGRGSAAREVVAAFLEEVRANPPGSAGELRRRIVNRN
jgi:hypothetical protein